MAFSPWKEKSPNLVYGLIDQAAAEMSWVGASSRTSRPAAKRTPVMTWARGAKLLCARHWPLASLMSSNARGNTASRDTALRFAGDTVRAAGHGLTNRARIHVHAVNAAVGTIRGAVMTADHGFPKPTAMSGQPKREGAARGRQGSRTILALLALLLAPLRHAVAAIRSNPRAPIPIAASAPIQPWRVRLLWEFDAMDTASGGRVHGWKAPALIDLRLSEHGPLREGLSSDWHVDLIRILGSNPSRDAGDIQVLDNLSAHHAWRLYRAFWQVSDTRAHWAVRLGWQGYDELFGLVPDGGDLLNSSFGQMPTSSQAGTPIWPQTAPGISVRWHPLAFYVMAGLWSGVPRDPGIPQGWNLPRRGDGSLQVLEVGLDHHARYKLALGTWALHRSGVAQQAHRGVYALADVVLLGAGRARRLGGFLQWGQTQPYLSAVGRYLGAGLRLRTRRHGRVSVGVARALLSPAFRLRHPGSARAETVYELTWRAHLNAHVSLQPDLQYIVHPGLAPQATHALEIGLRVNGSF